MRHMSLQMRVALLSVVALIVCTVALTVVSVYSVEGIISSSEDYWGTQYGGDDLDALPQGQENADTVITLRKFNGDTIDGTCKNSRRSRFRIRASSSPKSKGLIR